MITKMNLFGGETRDELLELARNTDSSKFDWALGDVNGASDEFLHEFKHLIYWKYVSMNLSFTRTQLDKFKDQISWKYFWLHNDFNEKLVDELIELVDWTGLSRSRNMTLSLVRKYKDKLDWFWILDNVHLKVLCQFSPEDYKMLEEDPEFSKYRGSVLDQELVNWQNRSQKYPDSNPHRKWMDRGFWYSVSGSGPFSEKFYERFKFQIEWVSCDVSTLSEEFFERNSDMMVWFNVGQRIDFSDQFKQKHHDELTCYRIDFTGDGSRVITFSGAQELEKRKASISAKGEVIAVTPNAYTESLRKQD